MSHDRSTRLVASASLLRVSRRHALAALISAVALVDGAARATTQTSTWVGTTSTSWNDPTNWNANNTFPNNGNAGISDFNVVINSATNQPALNVNATIDNLTLNTSANLTINAGITLNLAGPTLTNNGTILISTVSSPSFLNFTANTLLTGSGTIRLNTYSPDSQLTTAAGVTITNDTTHTIDGVGDIDAALVNNGTVNADSPLGPRTLLLQTSNMTNNKLFEATAGATMNISGITVTQGANGTIASAGGTVNMTGVTINGGTITGSSVNVSNSTFNNLKVASNTTILVLGGATLTYGGPTLTNNGIIEISNVGAPSTLNFTSNTLITGTGTILLNTYSPDAQLTAAANVTVTNDTNQTIAGVGDINAPLINNGIVNANATIGSKTLLLQNSNMTNNNLFEATGGGILSIQGITVTQGVSGIISNVASTVIINNATISGGTLTGSSFAVSNSNFTNVKIDTGATVTIQPGTKLNYSGATFTNNGTIQVDIQSSNATLNFTGNTTLTGTGTVFVDDWNPNAILSTSPNATLTNNQTIGGIGEIDASLINNGLINANIGFGSKTLFLQTNNMVNNNLMEATGNGTLAINGITITQGANGTIINAGGGNLTSVTLSAATISGGTISGNITVLSNSTLANLTIAAASIVVLNPAVVLNYSGATFTNNGLIQIDIFSSNADLNFTGNTTLTGTGTVFLDDYNPNARITGAVNATLTNNQTIHGIGEIDVALINNGTIIGDFTTGSRTLAFNGLTTNNGLIKATNTGIVAFSAGSIVAANGTLASTGTLQVDSNSTITSATPIASSAATIIFNGSNTTFSGFANATTNTGNITLQAGAAFAFPNSLTNAGTVNLNGANTTLTIPGIFNQTTGSLNGNGTLIAGSLAGNLTVASVPIQVPANGTLASKLTSLTISGSTSNWTGSLALNNNKLILETSNATKANALTTLRNQVIFGLTHPAGITTSNIPANFGIAVADNNALATPFTTFGGQPVDANSLLVSPELLGDADLSGKVDLSDLSTVLNNFGSTTPAWTSGNFDNASTINLTDLSDVLNNFGASNPNANASPAFAPTTPAPEPSSLLVLLAVPGFLGRRRTRRSAL